MGQYINNKTYTQFKKWSRNNGKLIFVNLFICIQVCTITLARHLRVPNKGLKVKYDWLLIGCFNDAHITQSLELVVSLLCPVNVYAFKKHCTVCLYLPACHHAGKWPHNMLILPQERLDVLCN